MANVALPRSVAAVALAVTALVVVAIVLLTNGTHNITGERTGGLSSPTPVTDPLRP